MMKSIEYLSALLLFLLCTSCRLDTNISEDLGNNYYYLGDGNESQILLNLKPNQPSKFGKTIVPPEVIEYNFSKSYIIAKSIDSHKKTERYWIVSKKENRIECLDSLAFFKKLEYSKIDLKLLPRK